MVYTSWKHSFTLFSKINTFNGLFVLPYGHACIDLDAIVCLDYCNLESKLNKVKKDKIFNKLELVSRKDFEILKKIVEKQEIQIRRLQKRKKLKR